MSMETPENTSQQQVSSAQQFKQRRETRERTEVLVLTSGLSVSVKRPEVTKMISKGLIPSQLVQRFMALQGKSENAIKPEDVTAILEFQRIVALHAVVTPTVVEENANYDNNEVNVDDFEESDLEDIWVYANGGLEAVEKFRKERDARLQAGSDSETLPEQTT